MRKTRKETKKELLKGKRKGETDDDFWLRMAREIIEKESEKKG